MLSRRFLALMAVILASPILADDKPPTTDKPTTSVAHIKLSGDLDESPVAADPLFGSAAESFHDKLGRIRKAKKDAAIQALYLHLDGLDTGWGKLDELSRAVADFRSSGKKAFAYVESGGSKEYLLGLACDKVYMPEAGWLMLVGVRAEAIFFKDLFEKIGVKADMMQMGAYKGAAEPFTRNKLSPENRQQLESLLDDFYEHQIVGRIVAARKQNDWKPDQVKKLIDRGPFTAKGALKEGLIDGLVYPEEIDKTLKKELKVETLKVVKDYAKPKGADLDLGNPLAILKMLAPSKPKKTKNPKVAVIYAVGVINTGKGGKSLLGGNSVGSTTMVEAIRQADDDETVKAIVLRVDSPGGSALASDLIWNELRRCTKPVIASMSDVAGSGGYYISMAAGKIYAEPGTITGSIGVVGGKLTLGGLFDLVGLKTETIKRGAHADILSFDRPFSPSEKEAFLTMMRDVYDQFLSKTLAGRTNAGKKMTREQLEKLAGGRIYTGRQAKENGLIDELGTIDDAIADAWKQAKMPKDVEPELLILPPPRSMIDTLLEMFEDVRTPSIRLERLPLLREVSERLGSLEGMIQLRDEPVWLVMPYSLRIK